MANVQEIVTALKSQTKELEQQGISEGEIVSVAFAYFSVMLSERVDRDHAINLAQWTLAELELTESQTDSAVAKLTGMKSFMQSSSDNAGEGGIKRILGLFRKAS